MAGRGGDVHGQAVRAAELAHSVGAISVGRTSTGEVDQVTDDHVAQDARGAAQQRKTQNSA